MLYGAPCSLPNCPLAPARAPPLRAPPVGQRELFCPLPNCSLPNCPPAHAALLRAPPPLFSRAAPLFSRAAAPLAYPGKSLGSCPTSHLASRCAVRGVIIVSGLALTQTPSPYPQP